MAKNVNKPLNTYIVNKISPVSLTSKQDHKDEPITKSTWKRYKNLDWFSDSWQFFSRTLTNRNAETFNQTGCWAKVLLMAWKGKLRMGHTNLKKYFNVKGQLILFEKRENIALVNKILLLEITLVKKCLKLYCHFNIVNINGKDKMISNEIAIDIYYQWRWVIL